MENEFEIETVENYYEGGYLVNGHIFVPNDEGNRMYKDVQQWIADGGVVDG